MTDITDLIDLAMPEPWQKIPYYTQKLVYFEGNKQKLQTLLASIIQDNLTAFIGEPKTSTRRSDLAIYETDLQEGVWIAYPYGVQKYHETEFEKLQQRFSQVRKGTFENQRKWLRLCMELCHKLDIQPIIVNMPITEKNIGLFPPGAYQSSVSLMASESKQYNCPFLNLQSKNFDLDNFTDMCHLNGRGGKKLLDHVGKQIAASSLQNSAPDSTNTRAPARQIAASEIVYCE